MVAIAIGFAIGASIGGGFEVGKQIILIVFDLLMEQPIAKLGIESLNNMPRYMIYSSAASSLLSGWY